MAETIRTCDVFVSHATKDASFALEVANAFRESGLETITETELLPGSDVSDALWEALAESRALLMILSPSGITPSMGLEIGAARAWSKPIYAVVTDSTLTRLPEVFTGVELYTIGRIQDVIRAVKTAIEPLTEEDRAFLKRAYSEMGLSLDRLSMDPVGRERLARAFRKNRGKVVAEERLLSELIRIRKQGKLTKNHANRRSTSIRKSG